jgi:hypothetical protein
MNRQDIERITSPGVSLIALASAILVAVDPDHALWWITPAPLVAAIGCILAVRVSVQYRARGAIAIFIALTIFWAGTAAFLITR